MVMNPGGNFQVYLKVNQLSMFEACKVTSGHLINFLHTVQGLRACREAH